DDFGFLKVTETALVFEGDSIRLTVPYTRVQNLRQQNPGWRALFSYGSQTSLSVTDRPEEGTFVFAERSSWILPTSRKNAWRMYESLRKKIEESTRFPHTE